MALPGNNRLLGSPVTGTGGGTLLANGLGVAQGSNPFSKAAASGAARQRREMQKTMKDMGEIAKANEVAREQARKKEEEEAKEAASREELSKRREEQERMEIDTSEESDEGDLETVVQVLDKEVEPSPLRKRSRGVEVARKEPAAVLASPPALQQSRFVAHKYN